MITIGLISDTHGFIDDDIFGFISVAEEIWHAGDIGSMAIADRLQAMKPLRAVCGNIDDHQVRSSFPRVQQFTVEDLKVLMVHIGGYPGHYERNITGLLREFKPNLFISGHSHILKVMPDKKLGLLHINPGASGKSGLHYVQTAVRFIINGNKIRDLEIYEKSRR